MQFDGGIGEGGRRGEMKQQVKEFYNNTNTVKDGMVSAREMLKKLQGHYLPELRTLYDECIWLKNKLDIDNKRDLQTSETRLLQFIVGVNLVINQIQSYNPSENSVDGDIALQNLENKIISTILPVKARLMERLNEKRNAENQQALLLQQQQQQQQQQSSISSSHFSATSSFYGAKDGHNYYPPYHTQSDEPVNVIGTKKRVVRQDASLPPPAQPQRHVKLKSSGHHFPRQQQQQQHLHHQQATFHDPSPSSSALLSSSISYASSYKSFSNGDYNYTDFDNGSINNNININIKSNSNSNNNNSVGLMRRTASDEFLMAYASNNDLAAGAMAGDVNDNIDFDSHMLAMSADDPDMDVDMGLMHYDNDDGHDDDDVDFAHMHMGAELYDESNILDDPWAASSGVETHSQGVGFNKINSGGLAASVQKQQIRGKVADPPYYPASSTRERPKPRNRTSSSTGGSRRKAKGKSSKSYSRGNYGGDDYGDDGEFKFSHGRSTAQEEVPMSAKRKKRLSQIVPNPRKPRYAEHTCSSCSELYQSVVMVNPWWAMYSHECPKCHKIQVPRIDINSPNNAIEMDPNVMALYGEGLDDSSDEVDGDQYDVEEEEELLGEATATGAPTMAELTSTAIASAAADGGNADGGSGNAAANENGVVNVDNTNDNIPDDTPFDGEGMLAKEEASKLLVLMCHARTCTGSHESQKHADICKSTKFLMLHIRDCSGTDQHGQACQFPWCLPCKRMLRHLTHCYEPATCSVCNPYGLPESLQQLKAINDQRTSLLTQQQDPKLLLEQQQQQQQQLVIPQSTQPQQNSQQQPQSQQISQQQQQLQLQQQQILLQQASQQSPQLLQLEAQRQYQEQLRLQQMQHQQQQQQLLYQQQYNLAIASASLYPQLNGNHISISSSSSSSGSSSSSSSSSVSIGGNNLRINTSTGSSNAVPTVITTPQGSAVVSKQHESSIATNLNSSSNSSSSSGNSFIASSSTNCSNSNSNSSSNINSNANANTNTGVVVVVKEETSVSMASVALASPLHLSPSSMLSISQQQQ